MISYNIRNILQISDERRKRVIDLYFNQQKTYAEIVQIERISPHDIHAIIKQEEARRQKHKQQARTLLYNYID
jgi:DNA-directed RNA polymerase specialized sigma subunit